MRGHKTLMCREICRESKKWIWTVGTTRQFRNHKNSEHIGQDGITNGGYLRSFAAMGHPMSGSRWIGQWDAVGHVSEDGI